MCWKCGKEIDLTGTVYRNSTCPNCGADLHCCKGCKFYSPGSHYDCHESVEELVSEKERANFCDYFSAGQNAVSKNSAGRGSGDSAQDKAAAARSAFDALFS